jgi:hypothetical protein
VVPRTWITGPARAWLKERMERPALRGPTRQSQARITHRLNRAASKRVTALRLFRRRLPLPATRHPSAVVARTATHRLASHCLRAHLRPRKQLLRATTPPSTGWISPSPMIDRHPKIRAKTPRPRARSRSFCVWRRVRGFSVRRTDGSLPRCRSRAVTRSTGSSRRYFATD